MQPSDKVLDKIRKLLAMATHKGSNENEAAIAMEKAQALLREYNLSVTDIKPGKEVTDDLITENFVGIPQDRKGSSWRHQLLGGIARSNSCRILVHGSSAWIIIGRAENIEVVKLLFAFITEQMESFASEAWKSYSGYEKRGAFRRGFFSGCTSRILNRLATELKEAQQASAQTQALVVITGMEVDRYIQRVYTTRQGRRGRGYSGYDGAVAGREAGNRINLRSTHRLE